MGGRGGAGRMCPRHTLGPLLDIMKVSVVVFIYVSVTI